MSGFQDLGGARYNIKAVDQFSKVFQQLRGEFEATRDAAKATRRELASAAADKGKFASAGQGDNQKNLQAELDAIRKQSSALKSRLALRQKLADQEAGEAATRQKAEDQASKAAQTAAKQAASVQIAEQRKRTVAEAAEQRKRAAAEQVAARAGAKAQADAAKAAKNAQRALQDAFEGSTSQGNKLLFTFRRLVGVLALFTLARKAVQGFGELVNSSIAFNAQVEQSRLGIGSLLVTLGDITDLATGKLVEGPAAFTAAVKLADDQVAKLRLDALRTTASFEQLAETFQQALAPGLRAGLKVDEIRELSVLISQGAAAIGVAQNALGEETRALFAGIISQRNSKIATALGFTPDQIKTATAEGKLFEVLKRRLQGFAAAADESQRTFTGLRQALNEAFQITTGKAGEAFFQELKGLLLDLIGIFVVFERDAKNAVIAIHPKEDTVAIFKQVFDALQSGVVAAREFIKNLDFTEVKRRTGDVLQTIQAVFSVLVSVGATLFRIIGPIVSSFAQFADAIKAIAPLVATIIGLKLQLFLVLNLVKNLTTAFGLLGKNSAVSGFAGIFAGGRKELGLATIASRGLGVGLAASFGIATLMVAEFGDMETDLAGAAEVVETVLVSALLDATNAAGQFFAQIQSTVALFDPALRAEKGIIASTKEFITQIVGETAKGALEIGSALPKALGGGSFGEAANELQKALDEIIIKNDELAEKLGIDRNKRLSDNIADLENKRSARAIELAQRLQEIADRKGAALKAKEEAKALAEQAKKDAEAASKGEGPGVSVTGKPREVTAKEKFELESAREKLALDQEAEKLEAATAIEKASTRSEDEQSLEILRAKSLELKQQEQILSQFHAIELKNFNDEHRADLDKLNGQDAQTQAKQELAILTARQALEEKKVGNEARITKHEFEEQNKIVNGSLAGGFSEGLLKFSQQFASEFKAGIELAQGALNSFASFVSSTIVDAFDPTQDFDLKERFARFLQDIARLALETFVKIALAKAIALAFSDGGQVQAAFEGGHVVPSFHRGGQARGYAGGGVIRGGTPGPAHFGIAQRRPKGLHPSDNQAVWVAINEFIHPVRAVRKYGLAFMESIRSGALSSEAVHALMAGTTFHPSSSAMAPGSTRVIGMATGGQVSGAGEIETIAAGRRGGDTIVRVLPVLVNDRQSVERLVAGRGGEVFDERDRRTSSQRGARDARRNQ